MKHRPRSWRIAAAALLAAGALIVGGCSGSSSTPSGAASEAAGGGSGGGEISVAMKTPTWILPISAPGKTQGENGIFRALQWPPLFSYTLEGAAKYNLDAERSMANIPEYSADGKTITITLKDLAWSDGKPITTRDVEFWFNLIKNNTDKWASYREGGFPDNVTEFKIIDEKTLSITTDKAYAPGYYIGNQLNSVVPLPQHAWAKTSDNDEVGDADRTAEGAKQIFAYLTKASEDPPHYAANELWKTVSGAWVLTDFVPSGEVKLVPNKGYKGSDKPHIPAVIFKPFTSDDAEFNVLRAGGIDYGYIPAGSISQKSYIEGQGYTVAPWYGWSITYIPFNFNNPTSGPIFDQKYIRQAMQYLIDQPTISKVIWQDMAAPTCGPVPQKPGSAGSMEGCKYAFDPAKAQQLLESHGWKVTPDGTTTCATPGEGDNQCGKGIDAGTPLKFTITSQSGFSATTKMMAELKSQFAKVGITLDIKEVPDSVAVTQACKKGDKNCSWDMSFFGSQASWYFPVYASGQRLFATGAPVNLGSYSNPEADKLIVATMFSADESVMQQYNDYLAEDLPVLWVPNPVAQVSAFKSNITGIVPQAPTLEMYPQDWAWK